MSISLHSRSNIVLAVAVLATAAALLLLVYRDHAFPPAADQETDAEADFAPLSLDEKFRILESLTPPEHALSPNEKRTILDTL